MPRVHMYEIWPMYICRAYNVQTHMIGAPLSFKGPPAHPTLLSSSGLSCSFVLRRRRLHHFVAVFVVLRCVLGRRLLSIWYDNFYWICEDLHTPCHVDPRRLLIRIGCICSYALGAATALHFVYQWPPFNSYQNYEHIVCAYNVLHAHGVARRLDAD